MTEKNKTLIFLLLAVVLLAFAWYSQPQLRPVKIDDVVGKPLFEKFTDPLAVKRLEIVRRNAAGEREEFRIVEVNGSWRIPSHDNYPADAKDQMGLIADALIDLKVIGIAEKMTDDTNAQSTNATAIHSTYGVLDPSGEETSLSENAGVKITLVGTNKETKIDETLVELIIGKAVEQNGNNPESNTAVNRYVRIAGQLPVYMVSIDIGRFSTQFDRWIEKNLLDIHSIDIAEIFIDDYSLDLQVTPERTLGVSLNNVADLTIAYNSNETGEKKWNLKKCMGYRGAQREYYEKSLNVNEELNVDVLDGLINSINNLKIVNVTKKPVKLAESLRSGEPFSKIKPDESLFKSGFYLVSAPNKSGQKGGESVKLLASQGDIQLRMKDGICYNLRFGELTGTQTMSDDKSKNENKTVDKDKEKDTDKGDTPAMMENRYLFINADFDGSIIPPADIQKLPEIPATGDQAAIDKIKKEREAKEKSNLREQERVAKAIESGKARVKKLSARFADWYYVISEDVYKKIHLTESIVIRPKTTPPINPNTTTTPPNPHNHNHGQEHDHNHNHAHPTTPEINLPGIDGEFNLPTE
ncbi:MAG: DUF4340 domain-containing protein [Planctomycetaceae bacterium]|jgi:hypothetical protein|nr:DUF4340 domain-containing protein [Planctomycetaceae bacterium]